MIEKIERAVIRLEAKVDAIHESQRSVVIEVRGIRQAQQQHGLAIERLAGQCSGRAETCGLVHEDLRRRTDRHSRQLGKVQDTTGKIAVAELERQAVRRSWLRVGRSIWRAKYFWLPIAAAAVAAIVAAVR